MAPMNDYIRLACISDIPALCDLLADLFCIETDFSPDREKQARGLEILLGDATGVSAVFVAEQDGKIIGMASIQVLVSTAEGGIVGQVEDVIVHRQSRRTGVGSRLLDHIIAWSRSRGLTRLQLLADCANASAIDFYASRGWRTTSLQCVRMQLV